MRRNETTGFENYFGERVEYSFLNPEEIIPLSEQEEASLGEGVSLRAVKRGITVTVGDYISGGGQAMVYRTDLQGYAAKIYETGERTVFLQNKLEKMVKMENKNPNICWPCDILKTDSGVFVGILIPFFDGKILNSLMTGNRKSIKDRYPEYNRLVQVEMILKILGAFKYLHDLNVLVGDVKPENVMFNKGKMDVLLVDMDSVQIGEFNCIHQTKGYDPPEIIQSIKNRSHEEKDPSGKYYYIEYYKDMYRTPKNESYALSVLIYSFLMEEKLPYTYEDWMDDGFQIGVYNDNILCVEHKFAYGVKLEDTSKNACKKAIWSHFPSFLKLAFVNAFANNRRYSDDEWIEIFTKYKKLLQSGKLSKVDADCMEPFPENHIDYNAVDFSAEEKVEKIDFSIKRAVVRIAKAMDSKLLEKRAEEIASILSHRPEVTVDYYRFRLIYNIGVLKKIKCENVL